ncbi:MAG TPA: hypothetical protein VEU08_09055, partial [Vicinamibacterales bacterium]|nr:hypothetical protein [Vicinamibacterales bacterium]
PSWRTVMDRKLTAAYRFASEHGPVALIAVVSIGFMAWLWMTTLSSMATTLRDHSQAVLAHSIRTAWPTRASRPPSAAAAIRTTMRSQNRSSGSYKRK